MWRTRLTFAGVMFLAAGGTAHAGALKEVSKGLHQAAGDGGGQGGGSSGNNSHQEDREQSPSHTESSCCYSRPDATLGYGYAVSPGPPGQDAQAEVYLGAQSVADSDGSMIIEARAFSDRFGLGLRYSSYFERTRPKLNEYVHLDLWWVGALWRLDRGENFDIWLELGFAGLNDPEGLSLTGGGAGLRAERRLGGMLSTVFGARHSWIQHDVHANELFAGVQASILQITYRIMDFDVGPPLRGPEVGVAFSF